MALENDLMDALKQAMRDKDQVALTALRAIKSAIMLIKTDGKGTILDPASEMQLIQKMIKQKQDAATEFRQHGRADLADNEDAEISIMAQFLPAQLSEIEVKTEIERIISELNATTIKDMGKVVGAASKTLAGKTDNATIGRIAKEILG